MSRRFRENHDCFCFTVSKTDSRTRRLRRRPLPLLPLRQANKSWLPSVKKMLKSIRKNAGNYVTLKLAAYILDTLCAPVCLFLPSETF